MASSRAKTALVVEYSIRAFLQVTVGQCYFWTLTRNDERPLTLKETKREFKRIYDWLRAKGCLFLGVFEPTKAGRWHPHLLLDTRISVVEFRAFLVSVGWGKICRVEKVVRSQREGGKFQEDVEGSAAYTARLNGAVRYLCKYLVKDLDGEVDDGAKQSRAFFSGPGVKHGTARFNWGRKLGRIWRLGAEWFVTIYRFQPKWSDRGEVFRLGWEDVITRKDWWEDHDWQFWMWAATTAQEADSPF